MARTKMIYRKVVSKSRPTESTIKDKVSKRVVPHLGGGRVHSAFGENAKPRGGAGRSTGITTGGRPHFTLS